MKYFLWSLLGVVLAYIIFAYHFGLNLSKWGEDRWQAYLILIGFYIVTILIVTYLDTKSRT